MSETKADERDELLEFAWVVIANAGGGDWDRASDEWREAAVRFRERWHVLIGVAPMLAYCPGCRASVDGVGRCDCASATR